MAPPRPCNHPGCPALVHEAYCEAHRKLDTYDKRRGSARARGYDYNWDKASKAYLIAHPLCLGCDAAGIVEAAVLTDHIVPFKGKRRLLWHHNNWQPSCKWHHDAVKQALERRWLDGALSNRDLRLDSPVALELAERMRPKGRGG